MQCMMGTGTYSDITMCKHEDYVEHVYLCMCGVCEE